MVYIFKSLLNYHLYSIDTISLKEESKIKMDSSFVKFKLKNQNNSNSNTFTQNFA